MSTYYLDKDYRLHVQPGEGLEPWVDENGCFDGKSVTYIEGFRVIPAGRTWSAPDGTLYTGQMIAAAVDYATLKKAQDELESGIAERADMQAALELLGVSVNE